LNDQFGWSLDISPDNNSLAVGKYMSDGGTMISVQLIGSRLAKTSPEKLTMMHSGILFPTLAMPKPLVSLPQNSMLRMVMIMWVA